jgi:RNA polymerase sigma factor (sigma-70 family)
MVRDRTGDPPRAWVSKDSSHYLFVASRHVLCFHARMGDSGHTDDPRCTCVQRPAFPLHAEAERGLLACAQQGCVRARQHLLADAVAPVRALVQARYPRDRDRDDLVQEALVELHSVIDRYNLAHPARVRLLTFARKALLGAAERYRRRRGIVAQEWAEDVELAQHEPDRLLDACDRARLISLLTPAIAQLAPRSLVVLEGRLLSDPPVRLRALAARLNVSHPRVAVLERQAIEQVQLSVLSALACRSAA